MIIIGCSGVGFKIAAIYIREERVLKELISVLNFMECELQYKFTPLPDLCRQAASYCSGSLSALFKSLTTELEAQISPDVERCMSYAISSHKELPSVTSNILQKFGRTLGRFDIKGQLKGIEDIRSECQMNLNTLLENKDNRLRSYRTLAICAGTAIAILFI